MANKLRGDPKQGDLTDMPCPICGDPLYESMGLVWCSHVESNRGSGSSCQYGVLAEVTLAQYKEDVRPKPLPAPAGVGFYIFEGIRYTASRKYIHKMYDLVEVRRHIEGKRRILLVYHMGVRDQQSVEFYDGTWTRVPIDFKGKRIL